MLKLQITLVNEEDEIPEKRRGSGEDRRANSSTCDTLNLRSSSI